MKELQNTNKSENITDEKLKELLIASQKAGFKKYLKDLDIDQNMFHEEGEKNAFYYLKALWFYFRYPISFFYPPICPSNTKKYENLKTIISNTGDFSIGKDISGKHYKATEALETLIRITKSDAKLNSVLLGLAILIAAGIFCMNPALSIPTFFLVLIGISVVGFTAIFIRAMFTKINNLGVFYQEKKYLGKALCLKVNEKNNDKQQNVVMSEEGMVRNSSHFEGENTTTPVQSSKGNNHTDLPKGSIDHTGSKNP